MKHYLIGISGKKRSGKDTFYQVFNTHVMAPKVAVRRYAFADAVKTFATKYFGYEESKKEEQRFILQGVGHMLREEVSENFWVDITYNQILKDREDFTSRGVVLVSVVTDVRYPNEVDSILERNGHIVRIIREDYEEPDPHPSETSLDNTQFDDVVLNNGDLLKYVDTVWRWTEKWKRAQSKSI